MSVKGRVTFRYKNRKKGTTETLTLDAVEFIRRFLLHVLPKGFMRIRHLGFLANRVKKELIQTCRIRLKALGKLSAAVEKSIRELMFSLSIYIDNHIRRLSKPAKDISNGFHLIAVRDEITAGASLTVRDAG